MPNLAGLADRAIVYHNHYAGANFTTPGTASLLTGVLPWTNRSFKIGSLSKSFFEKNIFSAFPGHYKIAYSHNFLVEMMLRRFVQNIDDFMRTEKLLLEGSSVPPFFGNDRDILTVSWIRYFEKGADRTAYSLFLSYLNEINNLIMDANYAHLKLQYPRGIPGISDSPGHVADFLLEDAIDWLQENLGLLPNPFIGYFHFYPPHSPYRTHRDFYHRFRGEKVPVQKTKDLFGKNSFNQVNKLRTEYDEFILYVDREFGRLFDYLDKSGILDNTWLILTSDHGEMFERGISGHVTPVLYEPLIRIPLMIFEPGRTKRLDVRQNTSAVDVLPTLLNVTGQEQPDWVEGGILPPFSEKESSSERSIYALEAKKNELNDPITIATIALMRDHYKLMYFFGYEKLGGEERVELYDLKNDPGELTDLSSTKRETTAELLSELKQKLAEVNQPYK
jgi:arylsulfatase A-like enzyme